MLQSNWRLLIVVMVATCLAGLLVRQRVARDHARGLHAMECDFARARATLWETCRSLERRFEGRIAPCRSSDEEQAALDRASPWQPQAMNDGSSAERQIRLTSPAATLGDYARLRRTWFRDEPWWVISTIQFHHADGDENRHDITLTCASVRGCER